MKNRVAPDQLFSALDGTQLQVGGADWRVEVFGVIDEPERRWVQIALEGTRRRILTLRLDPTQGARHVVRQISSWLTNPRSSRNVLQRVA